jgi:hypothetical protein
MEKITLLFLLFWSGGPLVWAELQPPLQLEDLQHDLNFKMPVPTPIPRPRSYSPGPLNDKVSWSIRPEFEFLQELHDRQFDLSDSIFNRRSPVPWKAQLILPLP